jgi:hypothetical protein
MVSEALGTPSLRVTFAAEKASELAKSVASTAMVVVAEPLIVAESANVCSPPEGVQSLAKFRSPLTPFQVYEATFPPFPQFADARQQSSG